MFYKDVNMGNTTDLLGQIRTGKRQVELADTLIRLERNKDFQVIMAHLTVTERLRLSDLLSSMPADSVEYAQTIRRMDALGHLGMYFREIKEIGEIAQVDVRQARQLLGEED